MPIIMERPEMSIEMWNSLKRHIMRQREKKKELEANAAIKNMQKREQEMRQKQNEMTIEEIKAELSQLEEKLKSLQNDKHDMFQFLKKVLNEEKRRNEEKKEEKEQMHLNHYANQAVAASASSHYLISGNRVLTHNGVVYQMENNPPSQQNGTIKRPRSPSPSSSSGSGYNQGYGFRGHVAPYGQPYPLPHPTGQYPPREQPKHVPANYHIPHMPQPGYRGGMPQQMDHSSPKPSNLSDHIQPGGISSGFPIRTQPQAAYFQPTTSHCVTAPHQVPLRKEDLMRRNMNESHQSHR